MNDKTRINRVVTRTGDEGSTGLADGSRLSKDDARIEALGAIDELNGALGVLATTASDHAGLLAQLQNRLFDLGAELAVPGATRLTDEHVQQLEREADNRNRQLPPLREFVLPGGCEAGAWCHYCRTIARRAERRLVTLSKQADINPAALQWLNRLSDVLFILARQINISAGAAESLWQHGQ